MLKYDAYDPRAVITGRSPVQFIWDPTDERRRWLTVTQAAKAIGRHRATINRWVATGRLELGRLPSGRTVILASSLLAIRPEDTGPIPGVLDVEIPSRQRPDITKRIFADRKRSVVPTTNC